MSVTTYKGMTMPVVLGSGSTTVNQWDETHLRSVSGTYYVWSIVLLSKYNAYANANFVFKLWKNNVLQKSQNIVMSAGTNKANLELSYALAVTSSDTVRYTIDVPSNYSAWGLFMSAIKVTFTAVPKQKWWHFWEWGSGTEPVATPVQSVSEAQKSQHEMEMQRENKDSQVEITGKMYLNGNLVYTGIVTLNSGNPRAHFLKTINAPVGAQIYWTVQKNPTTASGGCSMICDSFN